MTSKTARINAARRAAERRAPPDLAALAAHVRDLDGAISAEEDAIAYHNECITEHEANYDRLSDDLYEAVLRLVAASDATAEGRLAALDGITATLEHSDALDEKPLDFDHPGRWRGWDERERDAWHEALDAPRPAPAASPAAGGG